MHRTETIPQQRLGRAPKKQKSNTGSAGKNPSFQPIRDRLNGKGDPTISVDLLVKSLLAMAADKKTIAKGTVQNMRLICEYAARTVQKLV